jgi:uncharacterized membrane protein YGL010W
MKTLTDHLAQYAAYHRDRRNIATHLVGVPMIVLAVTVLLARPSVTVAGLPLSVALVAALATALFYLRLDLRFGVVMAALLGAAVALAQALADLAWGPWLAVGLGLFVGGWIIQFVGHAFEGRKPAFVDDLVGLVIGPLFVVAELAFALGLRRDVQVEVERRAGPQRGGPAAGVPR